ncbi:MAG TPA: GPP34 family phosphoprotein [Micromonosporaceae bacterium]|nr:GPP34 family phosphoprotein [Micromonosporaceae bacterium]
MDRRILNLGLAGAILLELWLTGRIQIGKDFQIHLNTYRPDPGRISIVDPEFYGDPLTDRAMKLIRTTGGRFYAAEFIRQFATPDLYDRVQGDMLATGVLKREVRRRPRGHLGRRPYPIQIRSKVRDLANPRHPDDSGFELPDMQTVALSGLVAALGLARHTYHSEAAQLHGTLMDLVHRLYDNTIRDVVAAINPASRRHARWCVSGSNRSDLGGGCIRPPPRASDPGEA